MRALADTHVTLSAEATHDWRMNWRRADKLSRRDLARMFTRGKSGRIALYTSDGYLIGIATAEGWAK